ncbi:hypothetical protein Q7P37_008806 [Cladosporium fusiforme]
MRTLHCINSINISMNSKSSRSNARRDQGFDAAYDTPMNNAASQPPASKKGPAAARVATPKTAPSMASAPSRSKSALSRKQTRTRISSAYKHPQAASGHGKKSVSATQAITTPASPSTKRGVVAHQRSQQATKVSLPRSIAQSPLFKLPSELRNHVYNYALAAEDGVIRITRKEGIPEPGLLTACKFIRKEAIGVFYDINRVSIVALDYHPAAYILFTAKVHSLDLIVDGFVETPGSNNWHNLKLWLRAIHSGKAAGLSDKPSCVDGLPERSKLHFAMVQGLLAIAKKMSREPWESVEQSLELCRAGLIGLEPGWASDEIIKA